MSETPTFPTEPTIRTVHLPEAGGRLGPEPEHFVVEEIPAYPASGEGEHLYLWIEKRLENTRDVAQRLAKAAGVPERDVGFAGMKDKHAVTRQWFSLPTKKEPDSSWNLGEGAHIVRTTRHKNKIRTGHLIGNRFRITLTEVPEGGVERAAAIFAFLTREGLLNFFGPQRFGRGGRNLGDALAWLEGEVRGPAPGATPGDDETGPDRGMKRRRGRRQRGPDEKLLSSVIQSEVFNRYAILRAALPDELLFGEVVRLANTGTHFIVEDVERELPRRRSGDLLPTGAMFGPKTLASRGRARELEREALASLNLDERHETALGRHAPGARRDLVVFPEGLRVEAGAAGSLVVEFALPAGGYATQVIRELTRAPWSELRPEAGAG